MYYYDYCDLDSLADSYIINMISENCDSFLRSFFLYKDAGEKMYAGPVWDMDLTFGMSVSGIVSPKKSNVSHNPLPKALLKLPVDPNAHIWDPGI